MITLKNSANAIQSEYDENHIERLLVDKYKKPISSLYEHSENNDYIHVNPFCNHFHVGFRIAENKTMHC